MFREDVNLLVYLLTQSLHTYFVARGQSCGDDVSTRCVVLLGRVTNGVRAAVCAPEARNCVHRSVCWLVRPAAECGGCRSSNAEIVAREVPLATETSAERHMSHQHSQRAGIADVGFVGTGVGVALGVVLLSVLFQWVQNHATVSARTWYPLKLALPCGELSTACGSPLGISMGRGNVARRISPAPCRAGSIFCIIVILGVRLAYAALPAGCIAVSGTLTNCSAFTGGATLSLSSQSLTAVQSGAFAGLSSVKTLCVVLMCFDA